MAAWPAGGAAISLDCDIGPLGTGISTGYSRVTTGAQRTVLENPTKLTQPELSLRVAQRLGAYHRSPDTPFALLPKGCALTTNGTPNFP